MNKFIYLTIAVVDVVVVVWFFVCFFFCVRFFFFFFFWGGGVVLFRDGGMWEWCQRRRLSLVGFN